MFYVREGVINEYAIKFVVPVPAQVHKLHFTWENLAGRPVSFKQSFLRREEGEEEKEKVFDVISLKMIRFLNDVNSRGGGGGEKLG